MPKVNRRRFLHLASAAGLTPLLPALRVPAAAATASASASKALWAGIYAKSGSAAQFQSVARNMGLSNAAIEGVSARSIGVRLAVASASAPVAPHRSVGRSGVSALQDKLDPSAKLKRRFERLIASDPQDATTPQDHGDAPEDQAPDLDR